MHFATMFIFRFMNSHLNQNSVKFCQIDDLFIKQRMSAKSFIEYGNFDNVKCHVNKLFSTSIRWQQQSDGIIYVYICKSELSVWNMLICQCTCVVS